MASSSNLTRNRGKRSHRGFTNTGSSYVPAPRFDDLPPASSWRLLVKVPELKSESHRGRHNGSLDTIPVISQVVGRSTPVSHPTALICAKSSVRVPAPLTIGNGDSVPHVSTVVTVRLHKMALKRYIFGVIRLLYCGALKLDLFREVITKIPKTILDILGSFGRRLRRHRDFICSVLREERRNRRKRHVFTVWPGGRYIEEPITQYYDKPAFCNAAPPASALPIPSEFVVEVRARDILAMKNAYIRKTIGADFNPSTFLPAAAPECLLAKGIWFMFSLSNAYLKYHGRKRMTRQVRRRGQGMSLDAIRREQQHERWMRDGKGRLFNWYILVPVALPESR